MNHEQMPDNKAQKFYTDRPKMENGTRVFQIAIDSIELQCVTFL